MMDFLREQTYALSQDPNARQRFGFAFEDNDKAQSKA